ncbi:MAG TPA: hypothetical protein VLG25_00920 [Patescibacteria group bacterium]|nr:hypothetical protein [Patescibacteria group bacterium]
MGSESGEQQGEIPRETLEFLSPRDVEVLNILMAIGLSARAATEYNFKGTDAYQISGAPSHRVYEDWLKTMLSIGVERMQYVDNSPSSSHNVYDILCPNESNYMQFCADTTRVLEMRQQIKAGKMPNSQGRSDMLAFNLGIRRASEHHFLTAMEPYINSNQRAPFDLLNGSLVYAFCDVTLGDMVGTRATSISDAQRKWMNQAQLDALRDGVVTLDDLVILPLLSYDIKT